jgi:DNA topoisomerase I
LHDPTVTWIAGWHENVMDNNKYVYLAASSSFKGISDRNKYEKARQLKNYIGRVRAHYQRTLDSKDDFECQAGTAMWVIDALALRVGGEKDEDEADTVGCCSLRVEHISFVEDVPAKDVAAAREQLKELEERRERGELIIGEEELEESAAAGAAQGITTGITLDFLGKDSMRYYKTMDLGRYGDIGKRVYNNLRRFVKGKQPTDEIFELLTPTSLNKELQSIMPGLSAKVFRTYNASVTLEQQLPDLDPGMSIDEKVLEYNRANREVSILCNHQRSVSKGFADQIGKMQKELELLEKQCEDLEAWAKKLKRGSPIPLKDTSKRCHSVKPGELSDDEKWMRLSERHMFAKEPGFDQVTERSAQYQTRLEKHKLKMKNKDENKAVALNTAKINYMDPRIT